LVDNTRVTVYNNRHTRKKGVTRLRTITFNSTKGGTGKSTLSIMLTNALAGAGYKCLAIDMDMINHSLSFYFNKDIPFDTLYKKNIFEVFAGSSIKNNVLPVTEKIDLVHADVRLSDFRSIETSKRLKKAMEGLDYDYAIIDTAPTFDNLTVNVLMASDILLVPVQQDVFNYQSVKYLFKKLSDLDIPELDIHVILNQYEKPRSENKATYANQLIDLFADDKVISDFINPVHISKSSVIRKYINGQNYRLNSRIETKKQYEELKSLIESVTRIKIEGDI
jgi:chromosome partitioning protein